MPRNLWTVEQFVADEKRRLDLFAAYWREQQTAEDWPERMTDCDWVEQLQIFGWPA